jgi:hypothetical protein
VRGAIWQAHEAGRLPYPETYRVRVEGSSDYNAVDIVGFKKTERILKVLCIGLGEMTPNERMERFSLVLVETMLWSQFTLFGSQNEDQNYENQNHNGDWKSHVICVVFDAVCAERLGTG